MTDARASRAAVVLAGGRGTRMGRDKASLSFGGETLLARVVRAVATEAQEVVVVGRRGQVLPPLPALAGARVRTTHDDARDRGPLAGLVAGLRAVAAPVAYATSCDVPTLSPRFVRAMFEALDGAGSGTEVAVAEAGGRLHPLAAAYRRGVLARAESRLAAGRLRLVDLVEGVAHVRVPEARLREADPDLASLANVNTPEDYEAALRRLAP
jgi:molybdopterin-guanine dinucleotide biosynthesis protein A